MKQLKAIAFVVGESACSRLDQAPEDAKSWYLLGHVELKLSQPNAAAQAFAKTDALIENDVSVKFYWLQARLLAE